VPELIYFQSVSGIVGLEFSGRSSRTRRLDDAHAKVSHPVVAAVDRAQRHLLASGRRA